MKHLTLRSLLLVLVTAIAASICHAQTTDTTGRGSGQVFADETMTYEGKISKLKISWTVADLTFSSVLQPDAKRLLITGEATSRGTLVKLFRYSFLQRYDTLVDIEDFRVLKTTTHDVQKQRVRDGEATFDHQAKRVTYVETDPKSPTRPPRRIASEITPDMLDMTTAIYAARLMPLEVGMRGELSVSDSGLVYKVPFTVTKRETQSTIFGKVSCLRVEPDIFGPGKLIEQKGKMVIWFTDDARRIPVRGEVSTEYGKGIARLKTYQKGTSITPAKPS